MSPAHPGAPPAVAIVGVGALGSALGLTLLLQRRVAPPELVLVDLAAGRAEAAAADLDQAAGLLGLAAGIRGGVDFELLQGARRVAVCAGHPPAPGVGPDELVEANVLLGRTIGELLAQHAPDALVVVATTPAHEVAAALAHAAGWSPSSVRWGGSGLEEERELDLMMMGGAGSARAAAAVALSSLLFEDRAVRHGGGVGFS